METTIEQIHKEWLTAAEILVSSCDEDRLEKLSNKVHRLSCLGFNNTKDDMNFVALQQAGWTKSLIEKYTISHPTNKIISKSDTIRLCEKYNLLLGELWMFSGFVPEKNLIEIEQFRHRDLQTWIVGEDFGGDHLFSSEEFFTEQAAKDNLSKRQEKVDELDSHNIHMARIGRSYRLMIRKKAELKIAAPKTDMRWAGNYEVDGVEIKEKKVYPDPVVLFPIEDGNYFLIVTAWGDEASDEIVINTKMN